MCTSASLFLLIFSDLHTGRRRLCIKEAFPTMCICHSLHHCLLICCYQGIGSAPRTLPLSSTIRDRACVCPTSTAFIFSALIRSPTLAVLPCNSVVIFCNATGESLISAMSSAKSKSVTFPVPHIMPLSHQSTVLLIKKSMTVRNRKGDSIHP